jgi:hypothetical protein
MTPKHIYTVKLCSLELEGTVKICSSYRKFEPPRSRNFRPKKILFLLNCASGKELSILVTAMMSISTVLVVNSCLMEQNLYLMLLMFKYAQVNVSGCFFLCSVSSLKMSYVSLFSSWVLDNELPVRLKTLSFDLNDVSPK